LIPSLLNSIYKDGSLHDPILSEKYLDSLISQKGTFEKGEAIDEITGGSFQLWPYRCQNSIAQITRRFSQ
jgi:hypothetical protein